MEETDCLDSCALETRVEIRTICNWITIEANEGLDADWRNGGMNTAGNTAEANREETEQRK